MSSFLRRLVFLGPPGAGKGTHAVALAAKAQMLHISTGDMLREAVAAGSELGMAAKTYMEAGKLVPDALIIDLIFDRMSNDEANAWILDGFPRTERQASSLDERLARSKSELDAVLLFEVPNEVLIQRLSSRLTCPACARVFNSIHNPPAAAGICDGCGGGLITRRDDQAKAVAERLKVYAESTIPLIGYYERLGKLIRVNANRSIATIRDEVEDLLDAER